MARHSLPTLTTLPADSTVLDELVADLRNARTGWTHARSAFHHCPSGEAQACLAEAQANLDALLDVYLDAR